LDYTTTANPIILLQINNLNLMWKYDIVAKSTV